MINEMPKNRKSSNHLLLVTVLLLILALPVFFISFRQTEIIRQNAQSRDNTQKIDTASQVSWPMFDFNGQKSGAHDKETIITKANVSTLKQLWQAKLPVADASPVYLSNVTTSAGTKNLVYITTTGASLIAFDDATGSQVWRKDTAGTSGTTTSTPAIDPNNQFIYSYGKDGKVHKYAVGTGVEDATAGWPLTVTLIPNVEKESSALSIGNGFLYVSTSAYPGDRGSYVGHVIAKNLATGAVSIFNSLCTSNKQIINGTCAQKQSGIWGRPGAVVDPVSGNVFVTTGNGIFSPPEYLGDSVVELSADLSKVIDTYTATNHQALNTADQDLGSTMPAMVPTQQGGNPPNLAVQGGKDNKLRVLNRENLSGQSGPYHTGGELQTIPVSCNIFSQPIAWNDTSNVTWVFVTDICDNLYAFKVTSSRLQQVYAKSKIGRSSPIIINGMLFIQMSKAIKAIDPATGSILWTAAADNMHWQSPIVINGKVFVLGASGTLTAYGTDTTNPPPSGGVVPTLFCLGGVPCITPSPTPSPTMPPVVIPTSQVVTESPGISLSPLNPSGIITNPPSGGTQNKGIIAILLLFIQLFLNFFLHFMGM
jgi:hypothetical protein